MHPENERVGGRGPGTGDGRKECQDGKHRQIEVESQRASLHIHAHNRLRFNRNPAMSKQYNKTEKRKRRTSYNKRKKDQAKTKKAESAAKKAA
jgi:hypothetical protein